MAGEAGRLLVRIRIGVTGHRTLRDEATIAGQVDGILSRIQEIAPSTEATQVLLEVVSPLGEGADRLVAERVLRVPSAVLEAPLPLPRSEYEEDFASQGSQQRFEELLGRAERSWVVGGPTRIDAYRAAGEYVVNSCDVLIAIWDGEPGRGLGGTEDILRMAQHNHMPIFVIGSEPPYRVTEERVPDSFRMVADVDRFNREDAPVHAARARASLAPAVDPPGDEGPLLEACFSWVEAAFARAETIAERCHASFVRTSRLVFLMSALATLAVAVSVETEGRVARASATLEVALMIGAFLAWLHVRRGLHERWITARFLAERLRSAAFLTFVGSDDDLGSRPRGEYRGNAQEWLRRVVREILRSRPDVDRSVRDLGTVKDVLDDAWLGRQREYYRRRGEGHERAYRTLTAASAILFGTAIGAAALHAFDLVEEPVSEAVVVLSIALPAMAAALIGVAGLEQHHRHGEHFRLMTARLHEQRHRLREAKDLERVRTVALRVEAFLRSESDAWIDVMRFHDVEVPVG